MALRIARHDTSDVVQLSDRSRWRIWPADVVTTLQWFPVTELELEPVQDEFCSHVLVNRADGSRVRVIGRTFELAIGASSAHSGANETPPHVDPYATPLTGLDVRFSKRCSRCLAPAQ